jgi:hypothetical protein
VKSVVLKAVTTFAVCATVLVGCSDEQPPAAQDGKTGWSDEEVTFDANGLTIYGSYLHPESEQPAPAALLISESGVTDRNGDNNVAGAVGNMRMIADRLSQRDVASLRYDKIGTGKTGLGAYQGRPAEVGSAVYTEGAQAAVAFLASQPGTDPDRISVYGLGEGTIHALTLATSGDPRIHSVGLLQPLAGRYLDLITSNLRLAVASDVEAGRQTQVQADDFMAQWAAVVQQVREQGTVPPDMNQVFAAYVNAGNVKAVAEADAIDPLALARSLAPGTPVLLTCSDIDQLADCAQMDGLIGALSQTDLQVVRLTGVNHVLKDGAADNVADYANGELSEQLTSALDTFAAK